ncbi:hypothetical protein PLESTF_000721200 [Pleodorina starrii]|nr:hypothetical protein PLESTF_000721200 [Pleodorina starrii]
MYSTTTGLGTKLQRQTCTSSSSAPKYNPVYRSCTSGRHLRSATLVKAGLDDPWPAPSSYKLWPTEISISSGLYNAIQGSELLFYGALVDAGFSGDWSRIGVLTTAQELVAQQAWWFILVAHSAVAAIAVQYALRQGYPPLQAGVRVRERRGRGGEGKL